jgi:hypothetical protein
MSGSLLTNPPTLLASAVLGVAPAKLTVTYVIDTSATKKALHIPYAVAKDGKVTSEFLDKGAKRAAGTPGIIVVKDVLPGNMVELFLNSDAHQSYRKQPVYAVTVGQKNVIVRITERLHPDPSPDHPHLVSTEADEYFDVYEAPLTGDIWMKVTHRYEENEVDALLDGARAEVKTAVRTIYAPGGLGSNELTIHVAEIANKPATKLVVTFEPGLNPIQNITSYNQSADGLPRVHPAGYAAIFEAAIAAEIPTTPQIPNPHPGLTSLKMSSCWRPSKGSIAHRAGLGLDVSQLGYLVLNRKRLAPSATSVSNGPGNVSDKERELYAAAEANRANEKKAVKDERAKKKALDAANANAERRRKAADKAEKHYDALRDNPVKGPPARAAWEDAETKSQAAAKKRDDAAEALQEAKVALMEAVKPDNAWTAERDQNPHAILVKKFRDALAQNKNSAQVFDPWLMQTTHAQRATSNWQEIENETIHEDHLHLTVKEVKILPDVF